MVLAYRSPTPAPLCLRQTSSAFFCQVLTVVPADLGACCRLRLQRDIRLSYFLVRIIQLLLVELYVTHLAGCIFYFLALTYPPDQEGLTWIGSLSLGPNSYENFRELPLGLVYVTSIYWSVVTMGTIGTPAASGAEAQTICAESHQFRDRGPDHVFRFPKRAHLLAKADQCL